MASKIVRYAILGCGKHARQSHAIYGEKVAELELVGLFDPKPDNILLVEQGVSTHRLRDVSFRD